MRGEEKILLPQKRHAESIWKRMAEKSGRLELPKKEKLEFAEEEPAQVAPAKIITPVPARTIFIEITKRQGKRRIVERIEGSEEEVNQIMQKNRTNGQLLFF